MIYSSEFDGTPARKGRALSFEHGHAVGKSLRAEQACSPLG
jgi:hypothetical protein